MINTLKSIERNMISEWWEKHKNVLDLLFKSYVKDTGDVVMSEYFFVERMFYTGSDVVENFNPQLN